MQEHHNFWLEDLAQHKGSEFDDHFYRNIISMHVHHFLRLKEQMEERVSLKARGKKHTAPHLQNELREMMTLLRQKEVLLRWPGRNEGFRAVDDFRTGMQMLQDGKIADFIARTTTHRDILGRGTTAAQSMASNLALFDEDELDELGRPSRTATTQPNPPLDDDELDMHLPKRHYTDGPPPAALSVSEGSLCLPDA